LLGAPALWCRLLAAAAVGRLEVEQPVYATLRLLAAAWGWSLAAEGTLAPRVSPSASGLAVWRAAIWRWRLLKAVYAGERLAVLVRRPAFLADGPKGREARRGDLLQGHFDRPKQPDCWLDVDVGGSGGLREPCTFDETAVLAAAHA